jgi:AraC-like DNA-binding protein
MKNFIKEIGIDNLPNDTITIGDDLALTPINNHTLSANNLKPHKLDHALIAVYTSGQCHIKINLNDYEIESPMLLTLMPGQIIEWVDHSPNIMGYAIALSKRFIDMLNLPGWQQQYMTMYNNPLNIITPDSMQPLRVFYAILYRAAENSENPFRLQVIENLIRVFYYGGLGSFRATDQCNKALKNSTVERFMELVQEHFRSERFINFYADKLCITPKYLSKLVKEKTGRSAGEWIESYVILEARTMLQSTDMTIQQIASALNFPNQSFFGKYFKRATGLSPKMCRQNNK